MRRSRIHLMMLAGIVLLLIAAPIAAASSEGSASTIQVIPLGSKSTGTPLITSTPASLIIFHTGQGPIENVWLMIVINKPTYDKLVSITINGNPFMTQGDFQLVKDKKIPPELPDKNTGYPGSLCQYEVNAIKSNMGEANSNPVYYALKFILSEITTSPTHFTLAVNFSGPASLKALILALGRYDKDTKHGFDLFCQPAPVCSPFNRDSSFSKSTFVVPEITTVALTASPFGAFGLYAVKRRRK